MDGQHINDRGPPARQISAILSATVSQVTYKSFYRILRLEVDNPYFASPDLNIAIQPNQGRDTSRIRSLWSKPTT